MAAFYSILQDPPQGLFSSFGVCYVRPCGSIDSLILNEGWRLVIIAILGFIFMLSVVMLGYAKGEPIFSLPLRVL